MRMVEFEDQYSILLLFYSFYPINMDSSGAYIGPTAENFDRGCLQCSPKMTLSQSTNMSATEPQHFARTAIDLGRPRAEEAVDQPDGVQGSDGSPLETQVSLCESLKTQTFSNAMNEGRRPVNNATKPHSTSSQLKVIEPQLQHNTTHQVTSLWPPSCADLPYKSGFPAGSTGSKPIQDNAML